MTDLLSNPDLKKLEELLDKATPGLWEAEHSRKWSYLKYLRDGIARYFRSEVRLDFHDANLIVESHNLLPSLIARLKSAEGALQFYRQFETNEGFAKHYNRTDVEGSFPGGSKIREHFTRVERGKGE